MKTVGWYSKNLNKIQLSSVHRLAYLIFYNDIINRLLIFMQIHICKYSELDTWNLISHPFQLSSWTLYLCINVFRVFLCLSISRLIINVRCYFFLPFQVVVRYISGIWNLDWNDVKRTSDIWIRYLFCNKLISK